MIKKLKIIVWFKCLDRNGQFLFTVCNERRNLQFYSTECFDIQMELHLVVYNSNYSY
jgi:hypothetical protein